MESVELYDRYHELVDKRLLGSLDFAELSELELIEAHLDAEGQDEAERMTAVGEELRRERRDVIASINQLLARFKTTS